MAANTKTETSAERALSLGSSYSFARALSQRSASTFAHCRANPCEKKNYKCIFRVGFISADPLFVIDISIMKRLNGYDEIFRILHTRKLLLRGFGDPVIIQICLNVFDVHVTKLFEEREVINMTSFFLASECRTNE